MTIKLISPDHTNRGGKNNIWGYFENLKAISFAKTKDGKEKYILGSGLLCEDQLVKIWDTTFYGGRYLGEPEPGICNIEDSKVGHDVLDHIDKTRNFYEKVKAKSQWRTPKNNE